MLRSIMAMLALVMFVSVKHANAEEASYCQIGETVEKARTIWQVEAERPPIALCSTCSTTTGACDIYNSDPNSYDAVGSGSLLRVPIVFHNIMASDSTGFVPDSLMRRQVAVLNDAFLASAGTFAEGSPGSRVFFYLAGVTRVVNQTWFENLNSYSDYDSVVGATIIWDPDKYLNIVTHNTYFGGLSSYPWFSESHPWFNFVRMRYDHIGVSPDERIVVHEVGHWFGLYHIEEDLCQPDCSSDPNTTGDLVADTSPTLPGCQTNGWTCTSQPVYWCDQYYNGFNNYMQAGGSPGCWNEFSEVQTGRMRCGLQTYHGSVYDSISVSVTTNVDSYLVTCPEGDDDTFVVYLDFLDAGMEHDIDASDLSLAPVGPDSLYQLWEDIVADSAATGSNGWETTISHSRIGGCDVDSVVVLLNRVPIGMAYYSGRSYDYHQSSPGHVDSSDLTRLAADVYDSLYQECSDFDPLTTSYHEVDSSDLVAFAAHVGHAAPSAKPAFGTTELVLNQLQSPSGETRVQVSLEQIEGFFVLAVVLRPDAGALDYRSWNAVSLEGVDTYLVESEDAAGPRVTLIVVAPGGSVATNMTLGVLSFGSTGQVNVSSDLAMSFGQAATRDGTVSSLRVQGKGWVVGDAAAPTQTRLFPNRPNPFNPRTEIEYSLGREGYADLSIYDVSGRLVRTLVASVQPAGEYRVTWNGLDTRGRTVASGVYVYRLKTPDYEESRRLVVIR